VLVTPKCFEPSRASVTIGATPATKRMFMGGECRTTGVKLDTVIDSPLGRIRARVDELADAGFDGVFTFEGPNDVFFPLAEAAPTRRVAVYSNVAVAFPRSPMHLAISAWDLQQASGGRFALGLGSQIRAHVERRYSADFERPVGRMEALIAAIRAIFDAWQHGTRLDHQSEFYTHTLHVPLLTPPPLEHGAPPIWLAAVGPQMTALAARVADGIVTHPFCTPRYLQTVMQPKLPTDRPFTRVVGAMVGLLGADSERADVEFALRAQLGFYGSTPAYRPVLDAHGWGEAQPELRRLTKANAWDELGAVFTDEMLDTIAVVGTPAEVSTELRRRYEGTADRLAIQLPYGADPDLVTELGSAWKA